MIHDLNYAQIIALIGMFAIAVTFYQIFYSLPKAADDKKKEARSIDGLKKAFADHDKLKT